MGGFLNAFLHLCDLCRVRMLFVSIFGISGSELLYVIGKVTRSLFLFGLLSSVGCIRFRRSRVKFVHFLYLCVDVSFFVSSFFESSRYVFCLSFVVLWFRAYGFRNLTCLTELETHR